MDACIGCFFSDIHYLESVREPCALLTGQKGSRKTERDWKKKEARWLTNGARKTRVLGGLQMKLPRSLWSHPRGTSNILWAYLATSGFGLDLISWRHARFWEDIELTELFQLYISISDCLFRSQPYISKLFFWNHPWMGSLWSSTTSAPTAALVDQAMKVDFHCKEVPQKGFLPG